MREIDVNVVTSTVKQMCIDANYELSSDMKAALSDAQEKEESELGKKIFSQLQENLRIARDDQIPICQDTGMAVFFIKVGQDVHLVGGSLTDAVNEGVRRGYTEGFLRKSVVSDPLILCQCLCGGIADARRGLLNRCPAEPATWRSC